MTYTLRRTHDGAGDSGGMSLGICPTFDQNTGKVTNIEYKNDAEPQIGWVLRVGSEYARTFGQDWWQTTPITAILEERTDPDDENFLYVRFWTGNSEYEWTRR